MQLYPSSVVEGINRGTAKKGQEDGEKEKNDLNINTNREHIKNVARSAWFQYTDSSPEYCLLICNAHIYIVLIKGKPTLR